MGDPIVRRRDGVIAYQLAVVVDDADAGITDVVRGRDIAPSTATQVMLQRLLGLPTPRYRHHFLLLEHSGRQAREAARLDPVLELRRPHTADELCGCSPTPRALSMSSPSCGRTYIRMVARAAGDRLAQVDKVARFTTV